MRERSCDALDNCRCDNESVTKFLFVALDPTVRMLLAVQRQLHCQLRDVTRLLPLLQKENDLLTQLEALIESFRDNEALAQPGEVSTSVGVLLKYLSFPLLVSCKLPCTLDWNFTTELGESSLIVRSVMFKCVGQAARIWKCLVRCIQVDELNMKNTCNDAGIWREAVTSVVSSLPSGQQLIDSQHYSVTVLDRGEVCIQELLEAVSVLLHMFSTPSLFDVWDGGLIVRLTDTCIAILGPAPTQSHNECHQSIGTSKSRSLPMSLRLSAAYTLHALLLLDLTPDSCRIWQHTFPGCFAGLYRALLPLIRLKHQYSNDALTLTLLKCLSKLLKIVLLQNPQGNTHTETTGASSPSSLLQELVQEANDSWNEREHQQVVQLSHSSCDRASAEQDRFLEQVKLRLPHPLMVLVPLLGRLSTRDTIREASGLLCTLHKARECWNDEQLTNAVYESCAMLASRDGIDQETLTECQQVLTSSENNGNLVDGRIVELIHELKTLALQQSQIELQRQLSLATSLLPRLDKASAKRFRVAFVSSEGAVDIVSCLMFLFDVDFSSQATAAGTCLVQTTSKVNEPPLTLNVLHRYLNADTVRLAHTFIRELGKVLRPKATADIVDSVFARMYQSSASRIERNSSLLGPSQVQWLHEWIGAFSVIRSLLLGAFESSSRLHLSLLSDLCGSVLPIITSGALFDLPCKPEECLPTQLQSAKAVIPMPSSNVSMFAVLGNTAAVNFQLELIREFARFLRGDFCRYLASCLFPMLTKAVPESPVRDMAGFALDSLVHSCEYKNLSSMIADNVGSLSGIITAALRIPGGGSIRGVVDFDSHTVNVAGTVALIFQLLSTSDTGGTIDMSNQQSLTSFRGAVKELLLRFDHSSARLDSSTESAAVFLRVFQCALRHLIPRRSGTVTHVGDAKSDAHENPWFQLLIPCMSIAESPKDGFARHCELKQSMHAGNDAPDTSDRDELTARTQYAAQLMSRCCYALSSSSLLIQTKSVDALISGFSYLGWIAANIPPAEEETNGPTTAILRQVHSTWTAIAGRVEAATSAVAAGETGGTTISLFQSLNVTNRPVPNQGEHRLFLSKLFVLVSNMAECAGDFMAVRLRESIWPCLSRVIATFLRRMRHPPHHANARHAYADSERSLVISAFALVERVYSHRSVGRALANLIPATGKMLLPFLGDAITDVAEACTQAVKAMLRIDCDALWRSLLELSGRQLLPCPLLEPAPFNDHLQGNALAARNTKATDKIACAAGKLVDFIEELPEQFLD